MAKDVINVDGKDVVVREDTAKGYRFVVWGVVTATICLAIMALLVGVFFGWAAKDGKIETPSQAANANTR